MKKNIYRIHFSSVDSTNNWAKANIHLLKQDQLTLVTADLQTKGRGRFKREWLSPFKQNLYVSFCFFVRKNQKDLSNIAQILSLSGIKALKQFGFKAGLKWPNDILVFGKKIGGILCEVVCLEDRLCLIAGIGLNINMPEETALKIDQPVTSLFIESGKEMELDFVLEALTQSFVTDLELFLQKGFAPFFEEYNKYLIYSKGQALEFRERDHILKGNFHSINRDGSMNLLMSSGLIKKIYSLEE